MGKFKVIGLIKRTPTNHEAASVRTYCKSCGRPLAGAGRHHEQCDRCYREQMRQDANGNEVVK